MLQQRQIITRNSRGVMMRETFTKSTSSHQITSVPTVLADRYNWSQSRRPVFFRAYSEDKWSWVCWRQWVGRRSTGGFDRIPFVAIPYAFYANIPPTTWEPLRVCDGTRPVKEHWYKRLPPDQRDWATRTVCVCVFFHWRERRNEFNERTKKRWAKSHI